MGWKWHQLNIWVMSDGSWTRGNESILALLDLFAAFNTPTMASFQEWQLWQEWSLHNCKSQASYPYVLVTSCFNYCNMKCIRKPHIQNSMAHILMHTLRLAQWLPICFMLQFKRPVIAFKTLHGLEPGYLKDHLLAVNTSLPNQCRKTRYVADPTYQGSTSSGTKEKDISLVAPSLWHTILPEIRLAPTFTLFWKALKTGSC